MVSSLSEEHCFPPCIIACQFSREICKFDVRNIFTSLYLSFAPHELRGVSPIL